jgi:hypothetical protein
MEADSGAKIAIRGKGSVKEGKGRSDAAHASNQEEDLHCLIMADTEEKVNKAKKLIHNIIETVSTYQGQISSSDSNSTLRPLLSLKAKTNSSVTSFESLPPSTVPSEMMKTKLVRTVVRLDIASTIVLSARTSLPASFAVFVVTLVTWLAIVPTARRVPAGATPMTPAAALLLESAAGMLLTAKWR